MRRIVCTHSTENARGDASEFTVAGKHFLKPNADGRILWHIVNFTPDMTKHKVIYAFSRAFDLWQQALDALPPLGRVLAFEPTDKYHEAHIHITFLEPGKKDHTIVRADGVTMKFTHAWPFDGNGQVLAHVPHGTTDIYFDEGENWSEIMKWEGDVLFASLMGVTLHEIGHVMNLGHSKVVPAVMNPETDGNNLDKLTADDLAGLTAAGWAKKKAEFAPADLVGNLVGASALSYIKSALRGVFVCQLIAETKDSTVSALYESGEFICIIIEDGQRDKKVFGETRIPGGIYDLEEYRAGKIYAKHKAKYGHDCVFLMKDVPGFIGIIPHVGNKVIHSNGCPLANRGFELDDATGNYYGLNSRNAYEKFYRRALALRAEGVALKWDARRTF